MKLYQIVETSDKNNDAGTKAVQDAAIIAENVGLKPVYIKKNEHRTNTILKSDSSS